MASAVCGILRADEGAGRRPDRHSEVARLQFQDRKLKRTYRSHLLPRSRQGKIALAAFLLLFVLTEPPAVFKLANRIAPWILGLPFLYAYLLALYVCLIGVLLWALRRGV